MQVLAGACGLWTWRVSTDGERQLVALLMAVTLFMAMGIWVRGNRVPLSRLGEPRAGTGPLLVRVVRIHRRVDRPASDDGRVVRLTPGQPLT